MVCTAGWNWRGRVCVLCRSLDEANGEAAKKRRTSGPRPTFDSEELERFLMIHVMKKLIAEALDARRSTNETFTATEWRTLSSTWAGATQRAIPDKPEAAKKTWVALKERFSLQSPEDVLELIVRDRPLVPAPENAKVGEFTQVGDQLLTTSEVALAQPAAPAAPAATTTGHAERVRVALGTGNSLSLTFSGPQRLPCMLTLGTATLSSLVLTHARVVGMALYEGRNKFVSGMDYARKFDLLVTSTQSGKTLWEKL